MQWMVENGADYVTTVKKNQPNMYEAITYYFEEKFKRNPQLAPDFVSRTGDDDADRRTVKHGRHEIRKIWISTDLNAYLAKEIGFPAVGQVYAIHRTRITYKKNKRTGFSQKWDFHQDIEFNILLVPTAASLHWPELHVP